MDNSVAVIILNWNAAPDTIACVQSLRAWQQVKVAVWVVDNASAPADVVAIRHACPEAQVLENSTNLGFAGGTNCGLRAVLMQSNGPTPLPAVLLLNNDARIAEASVVQLLKTLADPPPGYTAGLVGPLLYADPDKARLLSAGSRSMVLHHHNQIAAPPSEQPVYAVNYISGSVALLHPDLLKAVGLLDEAYFFSGEVADLCERARRHGYQTLVDSRATASHDLGRSSRLRSTLHTYYILRNRFLYIRKFYTGRLLNVPALLLTFFWALYNGGLAVKLQMQGQAGPARAVWLATIDGLVGRFGGQNERVLAVRDEFRPDPAVAGKSPANYGNQP